MQDSGITVVLGASLKVERYSNRAMEMLWQHRIDFEGIGNRSFEFREKKIINNIAESEWKANKIDTISLYLSAKNQEVWKEWIFLTKPRRVIFNPGTENEDFERALEARGILALRECTLVLLATNQY